MSSVDDVIGWRSIPGLVLGDTFRFNPQFRGTGEDITASFKDPGFLAAVRDIIGKPEGQIFDVDVARIWSLYLAQWDIVYTIHNLAGIEHFSSLAYLSCYGQQLTEIDLSKNTMLKQLSCWNNKLRKLDVSRNTALAYLDCDDNMLTELDVSSNTAH
jgi:hypothetical protein